MVIIFPDMRIGCDSTVESLTQGLARTHSTFTSSGTLPGDDLGKLVSLQSLNLQYTGLSGGSEEKYPLRCHISRQMITDCDMIGSNLRTFPTPTSYLSLRHNTSHDIGVDQTPISFVVPDVAEWYELPPSRGFK